MIRETTPEDKPVLLALAEDTGVFKPIEIEALAGVFDDYFATYHAQGHRSVIVQRHSVPVGFAYYALTSMTDRTYYLWWIAISKDIQAKGVGSELLRYVEEDIRNRNGRLLVIETSSLPHYEPTRRFYLKHHYEQAAVIRDYYADGDDLVVFRKRLAP
jgi:ribosomal protein S18 acetylase RimI-like enzyme